MYTNISGYYSTVWQSVPLGQREYDVKGPERFQSQRLGENLCVKLFHKCKMASVIMPMQQLCFPVQNLHTQMKTRAKEGDEIIINYMHKKFCKKPIWTTVFIEYRVFS